MRRRVVLGGALLLTACGSRVRLDVLAAAGEGTVAEALSGDRLRLDDKREVKLAGIAAPDGDAPYALNARTLLDRLAKGRRVQLLSAGALGDDAGRTLAHVRVKGGAWLQEALLREGAARVRPAPGERALAREMLEVEARARSRRRGLWALDAYRVLLPGELAPWASGLQIVEGRVQRVGATRSLTYIDFARDWSSVASAEVAARVVRDFETAGIDLRGLEGRLVRVRGNAQRLRIQVAAPEAVELLQGKGPMEDAAGYSGKRLAEKLGVKPGMTIVTVGAPSHYAALLGPLPQGVGIAAARPGEGAAGALTHVFVEDRAGLEQVVPAVAGWPPAGGMIWVSWPKKTSALFRDLTEDGVRGALLPTGWVDVKVCAVDADWSGLKFLRRRG